MHTSPNTSSQPGLGYGKGLRRSVERLWVSELAEELGDTDALVTGRAASAEPEAGDVNEMLQSVDLALTASPLRADLWTARFQLYANFGMKAEFARAMEMAWADARLKATLAWPDVFALWTRLAGFIDTAAEIAGDELAELDQAYQALRTQPDFFVQCARHTHRLLHRPSPLQEAARISGTTDRVRIFFKREDTRHDTLEMELAVAHSYLASRLGKTIIVTGSKENHFDAALRTAAPEFQLQPVICDTREEALRYWKSMTDCCHLALSDALGPSPYPQITLDFQSLLGHETDLQLRAKPGDARPRSMISSLHGHADAIGFNLMYLDRPEVALYCAEPLHAPMWSPNRRLRPYNGAIREQSWLRNSDRIRYVGVPDWKAQAAREKIRLLEKIDVSLEAARAVAVLLDLVQRETGTRDYVVLID